MNYVTVLIRTIDLGTPMSIRFHQTSELQGCAIEETVWEAIDEAWLGMGGKYLSFKLNAMEASDVSRVT